jgi:hypothetical protein
LRDGKNQKNRMRSSRLWLVSLGLAGICDCGMALYHSVLPYHMGWRRGLEGVPDSITWALLALNFSWSLLVILVGSLVLYAAKIGPAGGNFARRTVFTVGLFWAIHGSYTWLNPLPLPGSLWWLRYALAAFPAVVVVLHWLPLVADRGAPRESLSESLLGPNAPVPADPQKRGRPNPGQ